uniref:ribonuclease H n=1 Tax=Naja naja TaxID=35670 RepID=A0A8C6XLK6_NAJNA
MKIGGQQTTFLVDTGAGRSVVNKQITAPGPHQIQVQGVSGQILGQQVLKPVTCDFKGLEIQHEFLYIPECPIPLLGRDLLCKLDATISFDEGRQRVTVSHSPEETWRLMVGREIDRKKPDDKWRLFAVPGLWPEDNPLGFAAHHPPGIVEVKPGATPVHVGQRPVAWEALCAIYDSIQRYLKAGILVHIQSPWSTPIIPIKKPDGSFRPVQDLRPINNLTVTIHPAVPNPYTFLSLIPPQASLFSVIDLKDAFFTISIHPISQPLFVFEWEHPRTGTKTQYTWTSLPQGFKNSPTLFGTALAKDQQYYVPCQQGDTVLQYVDDVLVTGQTEDSCWDNTKILLELLLECGYRVSQKKAQLPEPCRIGALDARARLWSDDTEPPPFLACCRKHGH